MLDGATEGHLRTARHITHIDAGLSQIGLNALDVTWCPPLEPVVLVELANLALQKCGLICPQMRIDGLISCQLKLRLGFDF